MTSYYFQTNLICLILLTGLSMILNRRKGTLTSRQLSFTRLLLFTGILCFSDMFAWGMNGRSFPGVRVILELANMTYYACVSWVSYAWLNYVSICVHGLDFDHRKHGVITAIPVVTMTIVILLNPLTGYLFTFDADNVYHRGSGIYLHWLVSWGYLGFAAVLVVRRIRSSKTKIERSYFYPLVWFNLLPAVAAVAQMFFFGMTAMQCGITLSIVMIAFGSQQQQISVDPLTGLSNRMALSSYLASSVQRQGQRFTVIFCDIDHFKSINDTLGHARGDLMLKRSADVLRKTCSRVSEQLFLSRYGGDEFLICGTEQADDMPELFASALMEELSLLNAAYQGEHPLDISIGRAVGICSTEDEIERLIREADESMYAAKNGKRM